MATRIDFTPLFRTGIGFDRMLDALDAASRVRSPDNWPPYDIARIGEDSYRIDMAVAGFSEGDLTIDQDRNLLIVKGSKETAEEDGVSYLYRGIAGRSFERRFELADHVRVADARLNDGLLTIELRREIPEALKPRRIEISSSATTPTAADTPKIEATPTPTEPVAETGAKTGAEAQAGRAAA